MTGTVTGLFTHKSVPAIFEPPCKYRENSVFGTRRFTAVFTKDFSQPYSESSESSPRPHSLFM